MHTRHFNGYVVSAQVCHFVLSIRMFLYSTEESAYPNNRRMWLDHLRFLHREYLERRISKVQEVALLSAALAACTPLKYRPISCIHIILDNLGAVLAPSIIISIGAQYRNLLRPMFSRSEIAPSGLGVELFRVISTKRFIWTGILAQVGHHLQQSR